MNWFPDQTHYSLIFWECAENTKYGDPHYCGHSSHVKFTALQAADTHSKFKEGKLQVNTSHRQTDRVGTKEIPGRKRLFQREDRYQQASIKEKKTRHPAEENSRSDTGEAETQQLTSHILKRPLW